MVIDKNNFLKSFENNKQIDLELGCGPNKKNIKAIGIDILDYPCVDIVGDVFDILKQFQSGTVDNIFTYHFLEHISDIDLLIREMHRILKVNGKIFAVVPHFSNPFYYSDFTHKVHFGLYSFSYYSDNNFKRKVPQYQNEVLFNQDLVKLSFKSYRPRYVRHGLKKLLEIIFNINSYLQEFYEENLVYLFPCYEISYTLRKK
jgi:predicted SAM-dependent methyltransferase